MCGVVLLRKDAVLLYGFSLARPGEVAAESSA